MMIALLGVITIIFSPVLLDGKKIVAGEIEGNLFILIATFGTVFQTLVSKNVLRKINPYLVSVVSFLFGSLTFLPLAAKELNSWSFDQLNFQGLTGIIFNIGHVYIQTSAENREFEFEGIANPSSMKEAMKLAVKIWKNRNH